MPPSHAKPAEPRPSNRSTRQDTVEGVPLRGAHVVGLALLLVAPGLAIARLLNADRALTLAGWIGVASVVTYILYAWDKRRAQRGEWRIPEKVLHFWEVLGGWPGGFLAQRRLRHKSAKLSYLVTFWSIVALHNYLAIDAQLGWRLFHQARAWVASFM